MMQPDYGIDAPGVRRGMLACGGAGMLLVVVSRVMTPPIARSPNVASWLGAIGILVTLYGFGMAAYMTYGSRVGKRRTRERLLDRVQQVAGWSGCEQVLDVGCGRGLMMVGAARRLTTGAGGMAVGLDLWRAEDQTGNTPAAAFENAKREGVDGRVRIETGDARELPFADGTFDVVMSHWVVHNLPDAADRSRVLDEMLRVLRPGGTLVLADIAHHASYRAYLISKGVTDYWEDTGGIESRVMGLLSGGSYRPQAIVARRANETA